MKRIAVTGGRDFGARWRCRRCGVRWSDSQIAHLPECPKCVGQVALDEQGEAEVALVMRTLDAVHAKHGGFVLVHGACPSGADWLADLWVVEHDNVVLEHHAADWDAHGRGAGPRRNRVMALSGLDGCIAFPGGRGTANMVRECEAAGVPVWRVG